MVDLNKAIIYAKAGIYEEIAGDSLLQAMMEEPERFLSYLNWNNITDRFSFYKEFYRVFATWRGGRALGNMNINHWNVLLMDAYTQESKEFKQEEKGIQFNQKELDFLRLGLPPKEIEKAIEKIKTITYIFKGKKVVRGIPQKWSKSQTDWLKEQKSKGYKPKNIYEKYLNVFKAMPRRIEAIRTKMRRLK